MTNTTRRRRMFSIVVAAHLAMALWLCGRPVAADDIAPTVARISVRNAHLLSPDEVADALGLAVGEPLDAQALETAVARWNASEQYGSVAYRIEPLEEGGVDLVLSVHERVRIEGVLLRGNDELSDRRLREATGIEPGDVVGVLEARAAERAITDAYHRAGFPLVSVSSGALIADEERAIVFYVSEGERIYVDEVVFSGNASRPDKKLRKLMRTKTRKWWPLLGHGWYDPEVFHDDVPNIRADYYARGFLDAEADGRAIYSDDMTHVTLYVDVKEGPLYTVGQLQFEGNTLFRDGELADAIGMEPGDAYEPRTLETGVARVSELYAAQGHVDVTEESGNLVARPLFAQEGSEVTVQVSVREGEAVFIRNIRIEGLTKTKEHVVRRELTFYPGELADMRKVRRSEQLLLNTGYFDREHPRPVAIELEPNEGTLRDAVVRVREGSTGWFMLGGGVGSESGFIGEFSLTEENFDIGNWPESWHDIWSGNAWRGGGQRLSLILRAGTESAYFSLSWSDPAIFGSPYSGGVSVYNRMRARNEFDDERTGGYVSFGSRPTKTLRRNVSVGFESIDIDDIETPASAELLRDEGSHSKPFVRFSTTADHRDSRFVPTTGYMLGAEAELAAADVETARLELKGERYWTVRQNERGRGRHVLGVRGLAGVVAPYGDRVPVFERYYAGGFSTLRGFEYEGVSPIDPVTRQKVGGEGMLVGSVEYSVPLMEDEQVRLVPFVDAGYVTEDAEDVLTGWDDLRVSAGLGLRLQVPVFGPMGIEFDFAAPVVRESEDEERNFHFSVGAERVF